jgi:hypothetical protein
VPLKWHRVSLFCVYFGQTPVGVLYIKISIGSLFFENFEERRTLKCIKKFFKKLFQTVQIVNCLGFIIKTYHRGMGVNNREYR